MARKGEVTISFRPNVQFIDDFYRLQEWCAENGCSIGSVFNSVLPGLTYCVMNNTWISKKDGKRRVRVNLEDVILYAKGHTLSYRVRKNTVHR